MGEIDSNKTNKIVQGTLSQRAWNNGDGEGKWRGGFRKVLVLGPPMFIVIGVPKWDLMKRKEVLPMPQSCSGTIAS